MKQGYTLCPDGLYRKTVVFESGHKTGPRAGQLLTTEIIVRDKAGRMLKVERAKRQRHEIVNFTRES